MPDLGYILVFIALIVVMLLLFMLVLFLHRRLQSEISNRNFKQYIIYPVGRIIIERLSNVSRNEFIMILRSKCAEHDIKMTIDLERKVLDYICIEIFNKGELIEIENFLLFFNKLESDPKDVVTSEIANLIEDKIAYLERAFFTEHDALVKYKYKTVIEELKKTLQYVPETIERKNAVEKHNSSLQLTLGGFITVVIFSALLPSLFIHRTIQPLIATINSGDYIIIVGMLISIVLIVDIKTQ